MDFPIFSIEPVLPDAINPLFSFGANRRNKKLLSGFTEKQTNRKKRRRSKRKKHLRQ